ncbi:hypothetical protein ACROYT_G024391 [Oculina patagonica]
MATRTDLTSESSEMNEAGQKESDLITCVAFYYEKGSSGNSFLRKEKFRAVLTRGAKTLKKIRETVTNFGGLRDTAKKIGLGEHLEIKLARLDKSDAARGTQCFAINTDLQAELEMPSIRSGTDMLQVFVYPVEIAFSKSCPRIVVEVKEADSSRTAESATITKPPDPMETRQLTEKEKEQLRTELKARGNSTLFESEPVVVRLKKKSFKWAWKVRCGYCSKVLQLRPDAGVLAKINYLDKHHLNSCSKKRKQKEASQSIAKFMKTHAGTTPGNHNVESDLDNSDTEANIVQPSELHVVDSDIGELSSDCPDSPHSLSSHSSTHYNEDESDEYDEKDVEHYLDNNCRILAIGVEHADPVCVKLNEHIRRGLISKDKIFYRYLRDVVEIFIDPRHEYDAEVVEFFNSIAYLGGRRTANFLRGPMYAFQGQGSAHNPMECKMNLGGPSEQTCSKRQAGYTTESGVIKQLSVAHLTMSAKSNTKPLINNDLVTVIPSVFANDGTALKPAIEFDPREKKNVGLTVKADIAYVKSNPRPSAEFLKTNIVSEVLVSSVTNLDNSTSLPCAVDYVSKGGKSGQEMRNLFSSHCKTLQVCKCCQSSFSCRESILGPEATQVCKSSCDDCLRLQAVCENCRESGQVSHLPSLRACDRCLQNEQKCLRRAVVAFTTDCEEGNKKAMLSIQQAVEDGTIDNDLALLVPLPDCPHVGKSLKASFANWFLKLGNERGNLAILRTLRNKSDPTTKKTMRKLIPKNDYVRNKDRQDPMAVLKLTEHSMTSFLDSLDCVGHTIIPELDKYTERNKVGMYPNPISISTGPFGSLLFLSFDPASRKSNIHLAQLHSPITKIDTVAKDVAAEEVDYQDGVIFFCAKGSPIGFHELTKGAVVLNPERLKTRQMIQDKLDELGIEANGTIPVLREQISKHLVDVDAAYKENGFQSDQINFWHNRDPKKFESIHVIDLQLIYAACTTDRCIMSIHIQKDGIGLRGDYQSLITYGSDWEKVSSLCINNDKLYVAHQKGVEEVSLVNLRTVRVISAGGEECLMPHTLAPYGDGIVVSDPERHCVLKWSSSVRNVQVFAGDSTPGNNDGIATKCRFFQPSGICSEFNNVVYICDTQTSCIKVFTTLKKTAEFLKGIGELFAAFSIHEKHHKYDLCDLTTAIRRVGMCLQVLEENVASIRELNICLPSSLNGPEGSVAAKTVDSVKLLKWGLERLKQNLAPFGFEDTNLLSCMTLDIENLHSVVHHKSQVSTAFRYARDFGSTTKEGLKRTTSWSAYYFTSRGSWYPVPERSLGLFEIPSIPLPPAIKASQEEISMMREWAKAHGSSVRQRNVRQETTMARAGTLPDYLYQKDIQVGEKINLSSTTSPATTESQPEEEEEVTEYDSSSDEEACESDGFVEEDSAGCSLGNQQITRDVDFLVGITSRFGRPVRFNSRFVS